MTTSSTAAAPTSTDSPLRPSTRMLLTAGVVAGPIFVITGAVQALTREGFNLAHQPLSLLSLDDLGWIQITNFVLAGLLSLAFAVGVGRRLRSGPGHRWAPRLLAVFAIGLIIGGIFVPDPAFGYPVGTPDEIPSSFSFHGIMHAIAPPLAFVSLIVALLVIARRFATQDQGTAAIATRVTAVGCLVLVAPVGPGTSWRLFVGVALGFAWITAFAIRLIREAPDTTEGKRLG